MKILITGVEYDKRGMIGSRLYELLKNKHEVVPFFGDVRDLKNWINYLDRDFDFVIHLAALAGVRTSFDNPELYHDINVNGFEKCLHFCKLNGAKLLYASSSNAYEWWLNPYAATKKTTEDMAKVSGVPSIGMRFHTVWPGRDDMLFKKIERGEVKYINADHSRDFIHVDDLCRGIETIMDNIGVISRNVVDIGTGVSVNTLDVYKKYGKSEVEIRYNDSVGERIHTEADVDYLKELGWKPKHSIL